MTQGRNEISSTLVAAVLVVAGLVVGAAGSSYAQSEERNTPLADRLEDTVAVSNYGAFLGGSLETFLAGAGHNASPKLWVHGINSFLNIGPALDSVSSVDASIAVALPEDIFAQSASLGNYVGCGPFGEPSSHPLYGTGLVEIFAPGANQNSAADNIICSPGFAVGYPNTTGVFFPQGVAFESPYDGVYPGTDMVAVANLFPEVYGPDSGIAACADGGVSLGTITEYNRWTFTPGLNNVPPFNNSPVDAINPFTTATYTQNATLGGCLSLLAGPVGLAFDAYGFLYVVNNAGMLASTLAAAPRFLNVYGPGAFGDAFPWAVLGYVGATAGDVLEPVADTIDLDQNIYVTDTGDNSIKIFYPFTNFDATDFFFTGELIGEISGKMTHLKVPMGIALSADGEALYVANSGDNSLEMFTDFSPDEVQDLPPTLIITGPHSKLNLPVGVALPAFVASPTSTSTTEAARE